MARALQDLIVLAAIAVEVLLPAEACFGGKGGGGGGGVDPFYQDDEPSTRYVREQRERSIVQHSFDEGRERIQCRLLPRRNRLFVLGSCDGPTSCEDSCASMEEVN